jgi:hypothetical protein
VASFSLIGSVCFCCFGEVPTAFGGSREQCRSLVLPPDVRENPKLMACASSAKLLPPNNRELAIVRVSRSE